MVCTALPFRFLMVCTGKLSQSGPLWSALESYPAQISYSLQWKAISVMSLMVSTGKLFQSGLLESALESYPAQVSYGLH